MNTMDINGPIIIGRHGEIARVKQLPKDNNKLEQGVYYQVGEYVYQYISKVTRMRYIVPGTIAYYNGQYFISCYKTEEDQEMFHISKVKFEGDRPDTIDSIITEYVSSYNSGNNIVKNNPNKLAVSGEIYMPELNDTDDALTRIMKLMILHKKIVLNNYRSDFDKEYTMDNLRSALNGATINMTISKFLSWCDLLDLDWEFTLMDNGSNTLNPLTESLVIGKNKPLECDYGEDQKGIFKVPLIDGEDPLKRLIKVALIKMNVDLNNYKDKGSTPHLINNMRSALKRSSKMMMPYFVYWCEILGLDYLLTITDPVDGKTISADVNYKASDYIMQYDEDGSVIEPE